MIYNASKSYANQLDSGERYSLLNPVIALTIIDFNLFEQSPEIINSFVFQEENLKFVCNQEIKLVFVELRKFNKSLNDLETISDKWLYFLRRASELIDNLSVTEIAKLTSNIFNINSWQDLANLLD